MTLLIKTLRPELENVSLVIVHNEFTQNVIESSIKLLEEKCIHLKFSKSFITKIKMISIEMLQNISKQKSPSKSVLPCFIAVKSEGGIAIYTCNIVNNVSKKIIGKKLSAYNKMTKSDLKVFYKNALSSTVISETGNAGIGLLDIVYRSGEKVNFNFSDYKDGQSYFELKVNIQEIQIKKHNHV